MSDPQTPTEPGFYWRRVMHFGDHAKPGWRWAPAEVYLPYGAKEGTPLMTNGHELMDIVWGPKLAPPTDPEAEQSVEDWAKS